jgi:hypothetical protein
MLRSIRTRPGNVSGSLEEVQNLDGGNLLGAAYKIYRGETPAREIEQTHVREEFVPRKKQMYIGSASHNLRGSAQDQLSADAGLM